MTHAEYLREWRRKHPEKVKEYNRRQKALQKFARMKNEERCYSDPAYYAHVRQLQRIRQRRFYDKARKVEYRPRMSTRIPNWFAKGDMSMINYESQWLVENLTPSHRAFARELAIERRERRAV